MQSECTLKSQYTCSSYSMQGIPLKILIFFSNVLSLSSSTISCIIIMIPPTDIMCHDCDAPYWYHMMPPTGTMYHDCHCDAPYWYHVSWLSLWCPYWYHVSWLWCPYWWYHLSWLWCPLLVACVMTVMPPIGGTVYDDCVMITIRRDVPFFYTNIQNGDKQFDSNKSTRPFSHGRDLDAFPMTEEWALFQ